MKGLTSIIIKNSKKDNKIKSKKDLIILGISFLIVFGTISSIMVISSIVITRLLINQGRPYMFINVLITANYLMLLFNSIFSSLNTLYYSKDLKILLRKPIKPKTLGQKFYVDQIREKMIVFGLGPAGTGKTYLAMAMAINAFKNNDVNRIILTRPAIEAGEKLGFLPGDLQSKVDPYLRPLYDALYQIMGAESFASNMEKGLIEVAPLAYMRGRTLDNAYIILDEAQNTTPAQMKMFLTRIGFGSKVIITGDITQKDLPAGTVSGLDVAMRVLSKVDEIGFVKLTNKDVVRHPLVQKIVKAYEDYETAQNKRKSAKARGNRDDNKH